MKAITIHQPWALLVARGVKRYETRSWSTRYRGPIAVHAGKSCDALNGFWNEFQQYQTTFRYLNHEFVAHVYSSLIQFDFFKLSNFITGSIIAVGEITDCVPWSPDFDRQLTQRERMFGNYGTGRFAWQIDNVRMIEQPVPIKGQQGLWNWSQE